ncbi:MAG: metal ABC transporter permease [Alphaproteobacteria bacterium]
MDDLFWRAAIGGAVLGAVAGPIGCFVLWRRMAYLGASIAHMALLGVALGLIFGISPLLGVLATSIVAALLLARAPAYASSGAQTGPGGNPMGALVPADTLIGLVGHAGLALGFVLLATLETVRADLLGYLFGDVLAIDIADLIEIALMGALALLLLMLIWRPLLSDTVNPDIAAAEAGSAQGAYARVIFLALVAGLIAFGLKIVGALLIIALLVFPPAAARPFARSPEGMALMAALFGALAAPLGLWGAFEWDLPAGPAIVLAASVLYLATAAVARLRA